MFRLSDTQAIECTLTASITSNQLSGTAAYLDLPRQTGQSLITQLGATFTFSLNGPTDVTAVPMPNSGSVRNWDLLNIYNADSATAQVTVKMNSSGTDFLLKKHTLAPGETLFWSPEAGYGLL